MPVIATPNSQPREVCCEPLNGVPVNPSVVSCKGLNVLVVDPTEKFRKPLFERIQTVRITGGQQVTIQWTMRDRAGNPVDLTDCVCEGSNSSASLVIDESSNSSLTITCDYTVVFRMTEHLLLGSCVKHPVEIEGSVKDAANGIVEITIPADMTMVPGVYYGEIALMGSTDGEPYVYFSNSFYVAVETSRWSLSPKGPPTFAEIRLHLRDSSPAENTLLNELAFDDAEIAFAIGRPVLYWNEIPPDIRRYNTQTFPHRYHWLEGIAGELFQIAAEGYRKNHLAYSAAGVAIDDQNKEPNYEQAAARRLAVYKDFVRRKKAEMNLNAAFGEVGSDYGRIGRGGW